MKPGVAHYPTKDFEVIIEDGSLFEPNVRLAKFTFPDLMKGFTSRAASISFIPSFYSWNVEGGRPKATSGTAFEKENEQFLFNYTRSEYYFVIDRSGSMDGERMKRAVAILQAFLGAIPPQSLFNVYSFGSDYSSLYSSLKNASAANI